MTRRLVPLLSIASLSLFGVTAALWARSYRVGDRLYASRWRTDGVTATESAWWLLAGRGLAAVARRDQTVPVDRVSAGAFALLAERPETAWRQSWPAEPPLAERGGGVPAAIGFAHIDSPPGAGDASHYRQWQVPFWCPAVAFGLLPGWRAWRRLRRRRERGGQGFEVVRQAE
jgi:hypothetical protein